MVENWVAKLAGEHEAMVELLVKWARINSGSTHEAGVEEMMNAAVAAFAVLSPEVEALAHGVLLTKRPEAKRRVLLVGHVDTVYPHDSPFKDVTWLEEGQLRGPGVADMKGGLVVMLKALEALEGSGTSLGWSVYLSPDEELGSPNSRVILEGLASQFTVGLVFEPALPDGALVSARKGSANFLVTAHGVAAHAGRNFFEGKSAIVDLSHFIGQAAALANEEKGVTVNVGRISGGTSPNTVPALASCTVNVRAPNEKALHAVCSKILLLAEDLEVEGGVTRPPKPLDEKMERLLNLAASCAQELGIDLRWRPTGGVSDGNNLAAAGLADLDTLGVVGGNLHSLGEYVETKSLVERAQLTALLLKRIEEEEV